ncbi:hypothetical protein Pelo_11243 [Pelomyxa schiedti]|nr:hypothetical protein Pelo_11243 [Pelomyxa schiedti]
MNDIQYHVTTAPNALPDELKNEILAKTGIGAYISVLYEVPVEPEECFDTIFGLPEPCEITRLAIITGPPDPSLKESPSCFLAIESCSSAHCCAPSGERHIFIRLGHTQLFETDFEPSRTFRVLVSYGEPFGAPCYCLPFLFYTFPDSTGQNCFLTPDLQAPIQSLETDTSAPESRNVFNSEQGCNSAPETRQYECGPSTVAPQPVANALQNTTCANSFNGASGYPSLFAANTTQYLPQPLPVLLPLRPRPQTQCAACRVSMYTDHECDFFGSL